MTKTALYGLSTVPAPYTATQEHSLHFMTNVVEARASDDELHRGMLFLESIHDGCGIDRRYSVIEDFTRDDPAEFTFFPNNWRLDPVPSTKKRMEIYEEMSIAMAAEVAQQALMDAGVAPDEVTHLVVVTCTGLFAPGPDILLVERLGLPRDTRRTVIGFMGCYGAFNGLRTADQIVGNDPDAVVLNVCVELCTLHYQASLDPQAIVGNCLFGDGAAAAVYARAGRFSSPGLRVVDDHCAITHDSLDQMQWHIGDQGFTMVLDVEIPRTLLAGGSDFIDELLGRSRWDRSDVDAWVVHPGGPRIIDAVRDSAGVDEAQVAHSRAILREYGNMSSPTVLFVLKRFLDEEPQADRHVMLGFGPGLTMEGALLERL